jgi:hypothetical protein
LGAAELKSACRDDLYLEQIFKATSAEFLVALGAGGEQCDPEVNRFALNIKYACYWSPKK